MKRLQKQVDNAVRKTARQAVRIVRKNVPVAFGELRDSLHAESLPGPGQVATTIADAPHAAAVEVGSRPHLVPLDALIKWVKLRGMQGLSASGRVRNKRWSAKGMGSTTREHARRVAAQLKGLESGGSLSVDAPEQIARAIQQAILRKGTKPHWFVAKSMPEILRLLEQNVEAALNKSSRKSGGKAANDDGVLDGILEDGPAKEVEEMLGEVVSELPMLPPAS